MYTLASLVTLLVALMHAYFLLLEMFLWDKPLGLKTFAQNAEKAAVTKVMAANQGLYNGFLCAGLIWGVALGPAGDGIKLFCLSCVVIAGIFGALTVSRKILYVQAAPAALGLVLVLLS